MIARPAGHTDRPAPAAPEPQADRPLVVGLSLALALGLLAGTQYVAWRWGFPSSLGPPLVVVSAQTGRWLRVTAVLAAATAGVAVLVPRVRPLSLPLGFVALGTALAAVGPLYAPYRLFVWYAQYGRVPAAAPVFRSAWGLVVTVSVGAALAIMAAWRRGRRSSPSASHGSAHWGDAAALRRPRGLLLGRAGRTLLRVGGEGHVLTVAPTRSGKGVSAVIPNLLDYPGSVLVTDPKGENYAVTARWRGEALQTPVFAFDPFGVAEGDAAATYNPLDLIDAASAEAVDDARLIADMLVLPGAREGEQAFWNEEARGVLTGLILHVAATAPPEDRTLTHVRALLTLAPEPFNALLDAMQDTQAAGGLIARAAARIRQKADRERSGVLSTAQSHTHFLDSPRMAKVLERSSVDLAVLKRQPVTVYLILPTDRMDAYARWLRLMIGCALLAMARTRGQPQERVLFLLDEFAHLGRMHPVQRDIGLAGGFGVTFWLIVQDLAQLKSTYGETWLTFLANIGVLQAFGINDWDTAEYLSKMTGEATIRVASEHHSRAVSRGPHGQRQLGTGRTQSEQGRRLLLPDEVRRLPREAELLFVKGDPPLLVERLNYLHDREFQGRADPNPLYESVAEAAG
jgi:type IV secretion system protein VirD4